MQLKSRILQFLPRDLIVELNNICLDVLIDNNNAKVDMFIEALNKYDVEFYELGPGTNRFAVLIDGYVFKIALDKDGIRDNWSEFSMAEELQPYVTKVYECNGLIIVAEYVTAISKEEFNNCKDEIRELLANLAQSYLLGDVGSITKNFMNWGYRSNRDLVILDFAYIYRIIGDEMICKGVSKEGKVCETMLDYDQDFNNLVCPTCRKKYTFHEIRRRISKDYEQKELEKIKETTYLMRTPVAEVDGDVVIPNKNNEEGVKDMKYREYENEVNENIDLEALYADALNFVSKNKEIESESETIVYSTDPDENGYLPDEDVSDEDLSADTPDESRYDEEPVCDETQTTESFEDVDDYYDTLDDSDSDDEDDDNFEVVNTDSPEDNYLNSETPIEEKLEELSEEESENEETQDEEQEEVDNTEVVNIDFSQLPLYQEGVVDVNDCKTDEKQNKGFSADDVVILTSKDQDVEAMRDSLRNIESAEDYDDYYDDIVREKTERRMNNIKKRTNRD